MLFNSIEFGIFLPVVFAIYWWIGGRNWKFQNLLIVVASYFFYGWWDWRFLTLIAVSTLVDYFVGLKLSKVKQSSNRKQLLWLSIIVNLGFLGFFKYFNFFLENFMSAFSLFGEQIDVSSLRLILPIGISFYTFQSLSYTIDIYRNKIKPTENLLAFSAFVSFFPQLVAGPIERATSLLPQFLESRKFDYCKAVDGMKQILWGLFKKIVIADNCATYANLIFDNSNEYSGSTLVLGAVFFALQIYADFSGYTDIAIGVSRLFGFNLRRNFAFPYFSRDLAEFWRRWHISLSSWFKDYLYVPLGGSRGGNWRMIRNVYLVFIISGFWHGANWTFLFWGFLNATFYIPLVLLKKHRKNVDVVAEGKMLPSFRELLSMLLMFGFTTFSWIFFRAESIQQAFSYVSNIFSDSLFSVPNIPDRGTAFLTIVFITFLVLVEWNGREQQHALEKLGRTWSKPIRWTLYLLLILTTLVFSGQPKEFIYFQF